MSGVIKGTYRPGGSPNLPSDKGMLSTDLEMTKDAILKVAPQASQALAADGTSKAIGAVAGVNLSQEQMVSDQNVVELLQELLEVQRMTLEVLMEKLG